MSCLLEACEFARQDLRQRHASCGALALWGAVLAADVVAADPDAPCGPVDVHPAQREQFALAGSGHCGGEVHDALDAAKRVIRNGCDQRVELALIKETDLDLGVLDTWLCRQLAGVAGDPALAMGEFEDSMQEPDVVQR